MYKARFNSVFRLFMIFAKSEAMRSKPLPIRSSLQFILLTSALFVSLVLAVSGCSKYFTKYGSLYDAGILPLSTDNPYIATNSFISQEMQRSSFLNNFIRDKGGPHAIQVKRDGRSLIFYYPRSKIIYLASRVSAGSATRQWLITGPFKMSRRDFLEIRRLNPNLREEPILLAVNRAGDTIESIPDESMSKIHPQILVIQPTATPKPKKKKRLNRESSKGVGTKNDALIVKPALLPNADQQAISLSKNFAPRALNGDLIHQVNYDGETLESISSWYTGSLGNLGTISTANKFEPGHSLKRGESVLIPVNLVKNLVRKDK